MNWFRSKMPKEKQGPSYLEIGSRGERQNDGMEIRRKGFWRFLKRKGSRQKAKMTRVETRLEREWQFSAVVC